MHSNREKQSVLSDYKLFVRTHQQGTERELLFHTHSYYEIYIFHKGQCKYLVDNRIYDLQSGDIIVMDGKSLHKPFVSGEEQNYERSIVQFSFDWITPLLTFLDSNYLVEPFENKHHSIYRTNNNLHFKRIMEKIITLEEILNTGNLAESENELKVKLADLLFSINQLERITIIDGDQVNNEKKKYIQLVTDYVKDHFSQKITLEEIAENINLSKSYIVHLFKEQTGFTVMEYLMHYRLIQFLHLASIYPDKSIKELSFQCGFESEAHFSRFFKKHVGLSPREYRKKTSR